MRSVQRFSTQNINHHLLQRNGCVPNVRSVFYLFISMTYHFRIPAVWASLKPRTQTLLMNTFKCFKRDRTSFEYSTLTHKAWHPRLTSYSLQSRSTILSSWLWVRHGLKIIRSYCSMSPFLVTLTFFATATRSVEAGLGHIWGTA